MSKSINKKVNKAIAEEVKKGNIDDKIIFHGEIFGTPRSDSRGDSPIIRIKFTENSGMIVTVGNQNFMPDSKDLSDTKETIEKLANILRIDKAKVIVGAWMDRVGK